jgi:hypothetical protein
MKYISYILNLKPKTFVLVLFVCITSVQAIGQLSVSGSIIVESGATIKTAGSVSILGSVSGSGYVELNGLAQTLEAAGGSIPNLRISNGSCVRLLANCVVNNNLDFVAGKLILEDYNAVISSSASITGAGNAGYMVTNALGGIVREITSPSLVTIPVGSLDSYLPVTLTVGSVNGTGRVFTRYLDSLPVHYSNKFDDCFKGFWRVNYQNMSSVAATCQYASTAIFKGFSTNIKPLIVEQQLIKQNNNASNDTLTRSMFYGNISSNADLTGTNTYVLVTAKAFLQGAYNVAAGKMLDNLRTPTNLIPLTDPYRTSNYSNNFTHINNPNIEQALPSVFNDQSNTDDNIVDWVFIELRDANYLLKGTRSALLTRGGKIIDVDGRNGVLFKNIDSSDYVVTIRHRNHLGMAADASVKQPLGLNATAGIKFDFTNYTDAQIFGTQTAFATSTDGKRMMWGGNVNSNANIRYSGPSNDNAFLLSTILGGINTLILSNVYSAGDINMNRNVRYSGPGNDNAFLLSTVLGGISTTLITQQIPN